MNLIETLWNVKRSEKYCTVEFGEFNRDIVECKGWIARAAGSRPGEFNRDIVECKVRYDGNSGKLREKFNRDIVECKGF